MPRSDEKFKEHMREFCLHHQIYTARNDPITRLINDAFTEIPVSISRKDDNGFTPLRVAAAALNPIATRTLLELGTREDLAKRDNTDTRTPLMMCSDELRVSRECQETFLGKWGGYSDDRPHVEAMLKRVLGDIGTNEE